MAAPSTQNKQTIPQSPMNAVEKSVNSILEYGVRLRATDVHIEPRADHSVVRFRVDGYLGQSLALKGALHAEAITYLKTLAGLNPNVTNVPSKAEFEADFGSLPVTFQVSFMPTIAGMRAVVHIQNQLQNPLSLEDLGMGSHIEALVDTYLDSPHGVAIATSPDMLSRGTTLYSMLTRFDQKTYNIATLEKSILYKLDGVNQTEVAADAGFSMAKGIENVLAQDANVVMCSDVTDSQSAALLVDSALRGKVALCGLTTVDSVSALLRLADMGIEPFLVASTVKLVVASRLVRKLCPDCRKAYVPSADELNAVKERIGEFSPATAEITKSVPLDHHASITHKKIIPAPSKEELARKTILDRIATDPNFINRGLEESRVIEQKEQLQQNVPIDPNGAKIAFYSAVGCDKCSNTGYLGQVAVFEVLAVNRDLQEALAAKKPESDVREIALKNGMIPLARDAFDKAAHGLTSIPEILRVI